MKVVYVVLEAQYQSAVSSAVKSINAKNPKVGVEAGFSVLASSASGLGPTLPRSTCLDLSVFLQWSPLPALSPLVSPRHAAASATAHRPALRLSSISPPAAFLCLIISLSILWYSRKGVGYHAQSFIQHHGGLGRLNIPLGKHGHMLVVCSGCDGASDMLCRCALRSLGTCWRSCVTPRTMQPSRRMWSAATSSSAHSSSLRSWQRRCVCTELHAIHANRTPLHLPVLLQHL